MRIVHYISEIRREHGGTVRAVVDLCRALAARSHDVTLLVWNAVDWPAEAALDDRAPRLVVLPRPRGPLQRLPAAARRQAASAIDGADALHLHVVWDPVARWMAGAADRAGVPYVLTPHGMLDDWSMRQRAVKKRAYLALAGRRLLAGAAALHCASSGEAEESARWGTRAGAVEVIPLLIDLAPYRALPPRDGAPNEIPTVLFLGRLHRIKGIDLLVRAIALARERGCRTRLLVAGNDEQGIGAELGRLAADLGVAEDVSLLGFVDGERKRAMLRDADLLVLPSYHESFGYALFEALLCGTPAIATPGVKSAADLRESGGVTIAESDPPALAAAIVDVLGRADRGAASGAKARAWCLARYDEARVIEAYEAMYARRGRPRS